MIKPDLVHWQFKTRMDIKDKPAPASALGVDPKVVAFMSGIGTRLVGEDPIQAGQIIWRREPLNQREELEYEFSTRVGIEFGDYFYGISRLIP